jgi:ABC-type glycerol-3-phosphate transport system substrate-binding protein
MKRKKLFGFLLTLVLLFSLVGCGTKDDTGNNNDNISDDDKATETPEKDTLPTIDSLKLGEDYTELTASIKFLTHRDDIVNTKLAGYIAEFQKLYPNITIDYEAVTDYQEDIYGRWTSGDWGDICMIPTAVQKTELPTLFQTFGVYDKVGETYGFLDKFTNNAQVYGIASNAKPLGIFYNKKVFAKAGITVLPTSPDEYLAALKRIKEKTDAIPLYTNYAAGWTLGAWDDYIGGSATGDPDFYNNVLVHTKNPFSDGGDEAGPYAVYYILYEAVSRGLVEKDPTKTDWEKSKGMFLRGEIGTLVLGSWEVTLMKDAVDKPEDIGYMPFPISINKIQYASVNLDYGYGININSSEENKIASILYIKYLIEKSNFAYSEGGISIVKGAEYPDIYAAFIDVGLVVDNPAQDGEENFLNDVITKSEVGISIEYTHVQRIVEAALDNSETIDEITDRWNARWSAAQADSGVMVTEYKTP